MVALFASATAASAHATFTGAPGAIDAGTELTLSMDVPHERDDTTYNVDVVVAMPAGWVARSCEAAATWTCRTDTVDTRAVVRFTKAAGSGPAQDETFRFVVRAAPTAGRYAFPTVQTYNTGEVVRWIGAAGSAEPSPVLQVVGSAPVPTEAPATTATPPTTVPAPAPTTAPVPTSPVPTSAPPTTSRAADAVVASGATGGTGTAAPSVTVGGASGSSGVASSTPAPDEDDGGSGGLLLLVVLVAVAAAVAAWFLRRGRR